MKEDAYDVVVVGGGAAGLSAALVLGRARRRVAVIDAGAPRNAPATHMQGFFSRDGMLPADLLAEGRDEVTGYGVELVNDQVLAIEPGFVVRVASGRTVTARRILMATGVGDELPDVPGVRQRWGKDLLHCPYCRGWEVRDQPLGVLGALPGSAQHALLVRQWSDDVVFFVHTYHLMPAEQRQMEARRIRVVPGEVARFVVVLYKNGGYLRGRAKAVVVLGDGLPVSLRPQLPTGRVAWPRSRRAHELDPVRRCGRLHPEAAMYRYTGRPLARRTRTGAARRSTVRSPVDNRSPTRRSGRLVSAGAPHSRPRLTG